ncbi:hypothetical protein niasHT_029769 [Heterodera trifolii]|uniref:Effector protein n=1 Tax=Heterodera trifolii TaxID=157864 RepID=A0ABD2KRV1_9BILA
MTTFPTISAFLTIFITLSSLFYDAMCDDSFSDTFAKFILLRLTTGPIDNLVELDLKKVRELQQMIGQNAINHIVIEDGTFSGVYSCQSDIEFQFDEMSLGDGKMHRMLFSFGAILSAEIGGPEKTPYENSKYLRSLLKAYECAGGALKQVEQRQGIKTY